MRLSAGLVLFCLLEVLPEMYVPFVAYEGQNVTIPFDTKTTTNLTNYTIDVTRDDLPEVQESVFVRRNGEEIQNMHLEEYQGRVSIDQAELERGVVKLYFHNVLPTYHGKYRIYIPQLKKKFFFNMDVQPNRAGEASTTQEEEGAAKLKYLSLLVCVIPLIFLVVLAWRTKMIKKLWRNVMRRRAAGEPVTFNTAKEEVEVPLNDVN